MSDKPEFTLSCPLPIGRHTHVQLAHGGGGTLMHQLIEQVFLAQLGGPAPAELHDAATIEVAGQRLAFTTDSYVVQPLFFPGGDIGSLAVHGTVNDLAMAGARPLCLSAGFILEEGLPIETLERIVRSMREAAARARVRVVTGDTKVVDRGKGDGVFINTAGIGVLEHAGEIAPARVRPGDAVLLSGDLGRHGMAVMAVREGLAFQSRIESDSAPLADPVLGLLDAGLEVHCLRDLTRGGLASALNEIAAAARVAIRIVEDRVPVRDDVRAACEILGFDPLYVANEGRFVAFLPEPDAEKAAAVLRGFEVAVGAQVVGRVEEAGAGVVTVKNAMGATRVLDMLSGEQLPRIC